tara:strand:+ start:734 stop:3475 length:2742 start_codon:yes stop_codon:yes gene_type:complete
MTPEERAREQIDKLLESAGWVIQDRADLNPAAGLGVAVREFPIPGVGEADYLLYVDGKAAGAIEAKPAGKTLSGVSDQSENYMTALPDWLPSWGPELVFGYESSGTETLFRDGRDPDPRSRRIFAFQRPETLRRYLLEGDTLRGRLQGLPDLLTTGLRDCQVDAIHGLEHSFSAAKPRSLIQMATGAGKTFTACTFSWRLLKHAGAKRILFLVDRANLGDQTLREFQDYVPPQASGKFTDIYITQRLKAAGLDKDAKVVISTIQRVYAMLRGEELADEDEEKSDFEKNWSTKAEMPPITYNPNVPIETFDFIITDECHRSIYGVWRQVLDYFDAFLIGLTATPSKHTLGFFNQNLVAEYPYERSVVDGVNVGFEVYRIRTEVSEQGGQVEAGFPTPVRDKRTRQVRYQALDEDLDYEASDLDRKVLAPNQIRTVLETYRDRLFTELFPGRTGEWVPKTLIFAKDDHHAEEIVTIAREVFGKGNDFAKKITYQVTGDKPKALIKKFRNEPFPRIAVTVDMIATGTDIKPVEVLIFMRDVKSEGYFEQMKGRGVRTIDPAVLRAVTPDAQTKTRFILIDAVGVMDTKKNVSQPLERKRSVSLEALLEQIAMGRNDEDAISSLAGRLAALDQKLEPEAKLRIQSETDGKSLRDLSNALLDAVDPDAILLAAGNSSDQAAQTAAADTLRRDACKPFAKPEVRRLIVTLKKQTDIVIDEVTTDRLLEGGFSKVEAQKRVTSFKTFLEENRDELAALQILYNRPYGQQRLTFEAIKDLSLKLADPPHHLDTATVWQAYRRLDSAVVKGAPVEDLLTEIVALVRFALGQIKELHSVTVEVERKFNLWIGRRKQAGETFTDEQTVWLEGIRDVIAANFEISSRDFLDNPRFTDRGGLLKARALFGERLDPLLEDMAVALVA